MSGARPMTPTAHPTPAHSSTADARGPNDPPERRRRLLRSRTAVGWEGADGAGSGPSSEDTFVDHEDITRKNRHVGRTALADVSHRKHLRLDLPGDLSLIHI